MRPVHAMLHVRDLDRAVAFYERALGLAVADRHAYDGTRLVYMRVPGHAFEIELVERADWPWGDRPATGRTHFAFAVPDLDAAHRRLTAMGAGPEPIRDYRANGAHQTRFFYLHDPEGNEIELLEPVGRYAQGG